MTDFTGTPDADTWLGTGSNETAHGGGGNDDLDGGGGDDTIYGEADEDTLNGGDGNDTIWGGTGLDHLYGGAGDDIFWAHHADLADGEDYHGGSGTDAVLISTGASAIDLTGLVLDGIESLQAGAILVSGEPNRTVTMTPDQLNGLNRLSIGIGTLAISTGGAVDFSGGNLQLLIINLNAAGNALNLSGVTVQNYSPTDGPYIHGGGASDNVFGSDSHDRIYGHDGDDVLHGGRFGSDLLDGGAGNDRLMFTHMSSSDAFYGGSETDTFDASTTTAAVTVILGLNPGDVGSGPGGESQLYDIENLDGSSLGDALTGSNGANVIDGKAGNDVINGRLGADTLLGGAGNDSFNFTSVTVTSEELPVGRIDGGADYDTVDLRFVSPVTVGTVAGELGVFVGSQRFTIAGIELILLGSEDNFVSLPTNEAAPLEIRAGAGNDSVFAGGAHFIYGEDGNDRIFVSGTFGSGTIGHVDGGAGIDTLATNIGFTVDLAAGTATAFAASYSLAGIEDVELITNGYTSTARGDAGANRLTVSTLLDDGSVGVLLEGRAGNDVLIGSAGSDQLTGGDHNDFLDGGARADQMEGGAGDDTYVVDDAGDIVVELQGEGSDEIRTGLASYSLVGTQVEKLSGVGSVDQTLIGNDVANVIDGGAGADTITGGLGADTMIGGLGDDTFYVEEAGDIVTEAAGQGIDIVYSAVSYALTDASEVENLSALAWQSTEPLSLTGNALANTLIGNAGANQLNGLGGADVMIGREGDDVYLADNAGDWAIESAGQGNDIVYSAVSYTLAANSDVETLSTLGVGGTAPLNLTGNGLANILIGNAGANQLEGGAGNDVMYGREGNDIYIADGIGDVAIEYAGQGLDIVYSAVSYALNDSHEVENLSTIRWEATDGLNLTGNGLANTLIGNAGANQLDGRGGNDVMIGREGNDIYLADSAGDQAIEAPGQGIDIIYSAVSYALNDTHEVESLSTIRWEAADALDLTGNRLANTLIGNAGSNVLNGAGGVDVMIGREGNDIYIIDNAADQAVEAAGQGVDTIYAALSYALNDGSEVEALATLSFEGTDAINLTGNGLANTLTGNAGSNQLDGRGGNDVMIGREGGDIYLVDGLGDQVIEAAGQGYDAIYTSGHHVLAANSEVEGLSTITWEATNSINLGGNAADNYLIGNAGTNALDGKGGNDVLQGREGADRFGFTTALGAGNVDFIFDFEVGVDRIALDDAIFNALPLGALASGAFATGAAAQDGEDRIVYNPATGQLYYDADGSGPGAAIQFATLQAGLALTASDFQIL